MPKIVWIGRHLGHALSTSLLSQCELSRYVLCHRVDYAIKQLDDLLQKWEGLKKSRAKRTTTQMASEDSFNGSFNDLIARQDALAMMKIEEDNALLFAQWERDGEE